ncbi:MAG: MFS transporter [Pseudomonadota bacterium]
MSRWTILAVLFGARITMAFQFQSIAALAEPMADAYALTLADIGLLIGIYVAPGVVVAIPGAAVAARFGERRIVTIGMAMMLAGSVLIATAPEWPTLVAGRVLAGIGGVILNVLMTKMLVDWFAGKEVATALAIFVNSWPVGIALALVTLPMVASFGGLGLVWWVVAALVATGLIAFAAIYRDPPSEPHDAPAFSSQRLPYYSLMMASLVWALYNAALSMVFSFGPVVLIDQGWGTKAAGGAISVFMVVFALANPLGGWLSDRTGRRDLIIAVSTLSFVPLMPLIPLSPAWAAIPILVVVGALFALAAGPAMSLPALVLPPPIRTFGMGVYFAIYYVVMMAAPRIAGDLADRFGNAGVTMWLGAAFSVGTAISLALYRRSLAARGIPH